MASQVHTQRKNYPKKKRLLYQELQELPGTYDVIALSKMSKVRATQLMTIRKKFRNEIKIRVIKNRVAQRAFEKLSNLPGLDSLSKELEGQCALLFTHISPFKLNLIFDKNKVFLPAKGGDIATKDIIIPAGNTGISPGPVLSEFKEANVSTKIDQGTIWVGKDTVVVRSGSIISQKLASLMSKLNIKPIEAGISVSLAIADGLVLKENDLKINLAEYREELTRSFHEAVSLAIETSYPTVETITRLLVRAYQNATALTTDSGYLSPDSVQFVLVRANANGQIIANQARKSGYTPQ
ncbi:MAG TPA: 50S ribosomal protein L10 [Candidatus Nitrosopolaris rasttigaisensis]|jgi:large subunit ribosomal protein L10|nr:50S ribosomal protein L10 [Candidatus Nitrosopolaris rasttigaisensis]